ncbi:hypothetical protein [Xanthomonas arboricola]|uniref:hypothetical protein n=1 Tax=Xanthomonas arboricola TaxID=56448 RepID=UPI000C860F52|nr:hypothetical protein [Xanthomonas arboricola]SOU07484.1 hypothetical protein LMG19144_02545 [Xanthomonas arboricola pv. fragariae]
MSDAIAWAGSDGRRHLAIVGGGQAAKWLLFGLAERLARGERSLSQLRISVFERGWEFGTGFAWSRHNTLAEHETSLAAPISRVAFGDDQRRQFQDTVSLLREHGLIVDLRRGIEIASIQRENGALHLSITGGDSVRADAVVLASGHWQPRDPLEGAPGYHVSPWPAAKLQEDVCGRWLREGARASKRVLVLGTYLNALDAVISLSHRVGRFIEEADGGLRFEGPRQFSIVMGSRRGSLPRVWGRAPSLRPARVLTAAALESLRGAANAEGFVPLDACIELLEQEIALEQGQRPSLRLLRVAAGPGRKRCAADTTIGLRHRLASDLRAAFAPESGSRRYADTLRVPWQVALFSTLPVLSEYSHALCAEDEFDFDQRLRTRLFHHAMPMTLHSARKLQALMASGHLQVMALGPHYACVPNLQGVVLTSPALEALREIQEFTDVVRAYAGSGDIRHHPTSLVQGALRSGILQPAARYFRNPDHADTIAVRKGASALIERRRGPALVVGGVDVNPGTREVIGADSEFATADQPLLFAMGPLLIGQFLDAHSIGQLIRDSGRILDTLTSTQKRTK